MISLDTIDEMELTAQALVEAVKNEDDKGLTHLLNAIPVDEHYRLILYLCYLVGR